MTKSEKKKEELSEKEIDRSGEIVEPEKRLIDLEK